MILPIGLIVIIMACLTAITFGHPIDDYYNLHKNDSGMESKKIPPKLASLLVDDDYPEAIDLLQSMITLKYLNFYGDKNIIDTYANQAKSSKGSFESLLETVDGSRSVSVFGIKKRGKVRKIIGVVSTKSQFILIIGRGKLTQKQIESLPDLSKEIQ
jgi:hypothetical protein